MKPRWCVWHDARRVWPRAGWCRNTRFPLRCLPTIIGFRALSVTSYSRSRQQGNAGSNVMLWVARPKAVAQMYLSGCDWWKLSVSFLFGAFTIASPVFQAVGDGEILQDDPFRLVCVPKRDRVEDNCDMCPHHSRAWQILGVVTGSLKARRRLFPAI